MKLHFYLGSLHDKNQQYKEAFEHFQSCNQIRQKISGNFDLKSYQNIYHWLKTHVTQDYIKSKTSLADTSNKPIFIIGMPRSGTSLVEQILSSHSLVYGAGEISDMRQYANAFTRFDNEATFTEALNSLNSETAQAIRQAYLERLDNFSRSSANEPFVVDKLPHNFDALWLIKILFPNAKVIHCRRDPIDTCLSCFMTNFSSGHNYKHDLKTLGTYYNLYRDLMSYWNSLFPADQLLEIDYEELISNPEQNIRALLDYCGLEWEHQCLDFHETQRTVKTASYTQVREKLYSRSVKRWKNYEEFLAPLIDELNNA